jgi:hypothetical protein
VTVHTSADFISETKCVNHSPPWEPDSLSSSLRLPRLFWDPTVHYHLHINPQLDHIPSLINPIHILTSYFSVHFNNNLTHMFKSLKWFPTKILYTNLNCPMRATCSATTSLALLNWWDFRFWRRSMETAAFWDIGQCSLEVHRRFRGVYFFHDQVRMHLRNVGLLQRYYKTLQSRRLLRSYSTGSNEIFEKELH